MYTSIYLACMCISIQVHHIFVHIYVCVYIHIYRCYAGFCRVCVGWRGVLFAEYFEIPVLPIRCRIGPQALAEAAPEEARHVRALLLRVVHQQCLPSTWQSLYGKLRVFFWYTGGSSLVRGGSLDSRV